MRDDLHADQGLIPVLEAQLQREVRKLAAERGLITIHVPDSRGNPAGWPDLIILGPGGLLFRELKSDDGRPSLAQLQMGRYLKDLGQDWAIWRPADLPAAIGRQLTGIMKH